MESGVWQITSYVVDSKGRVLEVRDGNGNEISYTFDHGFSQPSKSIDAEGHETHFRYDEAGRLMEVLSGEGKICYGYNPLDYRTIETDEEGNTTRYVYDFLGNLIEKIRPNEYQNGVNSLRGIRYFYDDMDHLVKTITPESAVFAKKTNVEGKVLKEIHPNAYNPAIDDGEGISYQYDIHGNCTHIYYPDGGCERRFYDGSGNLTKKITPSEYALHGDDGKGFCYEYNLVNLLIQVINPEGIVEKRYIYDLCGKVVKEIGAKGYALGKTDDERPGILYRYNKAGWLLEKREPMDLETSGAALTIQYRLTKYEYDLCGNLIKELRYLDYQTVSSSRGRLQQISHFYNKNYQLIRTEDGAGAVLAYSYDERGRKTSERKRISEDCWQETLYRYDKAGRVIETATSADEKGTGKRYAVTKFCYDGNGNLLKIVTPAGYQISRSYNHDNRLIKEEHFEKHGDIDNCISYEYDKAGNLVSVTDGTGSSVNYNYDYFNREIQKVQPNGGTTYREYDKDNHLVKVILPNEYQTMGQHGVGYQYIYDAVGRLRKSVGPNGALLKEIHYTPWGEVESQLNGLGNGVCYQYDFGSRRIEVRTAGGSSQRYQYDAIGNVTGTEDGNGNRTSYQLDDWGRITRVQKADGSNEQFCYDFARNVIAAIDGEGNQTSFAFNRLNQLSKKIDAAGEAEEFFYDLEGRVCESTNRNGEVLRYHYNLYGDLTRRETKDHTLQELYGYYPDGRLKFAMGGGMRYDYSYYADGLLKAKKASGKMLLSYQYDLNGNKIAQQDITGKEVAYRYNCLDLLTEVYDNGKRQALYEYHPDHTLQRLVVGDSLISEYGYDQDQNIIRLQSRLGEQVLADNHYHFDGNGNQQLKETLEGKTIYGYDVLNRLSHVSYPEYEERFSYDGAGNRTKRLSGAVEEFYRYDERNRLVERTVHEGHEIKNLEYLYDNQGNLLKDEKAEYRYNGFNRVERVRLMDGSTQVNRYDGEGLRHEMEENGRLVQFLFSGQEVVVESKEDGEVIRYLRGYELIGSDSEWARTYYHYVSDEMGSITHVVAGDSKEVLNEYRYDAFGNTVYERELVENRFRYAGQQYDGVIGQYYLRARYYNPVVGRFTQEDTYYGDGLNLYAYCRGNPVGYYDPSGYASQKKYDTFKELKNTYDLNAQGAYDVLKMMEGKPDWTMQQAYDYYKFWQSADIVDSGNKTYTPYTSEMRKYIYPPDTGYQAYLESKYINIREMGLDDVSTVAKNTGLTEQKIIDMKKHVFLDTHEISFDGQPYQTAYFQADPDLAYSWEAAMKGPLNSDQKTWFEDMAKHELEESKLMKKGMPLRDPSTYQNGRFQEAPEKNAHDAAPKQPKLAFPGSIQDQEFLKYYDRDLNDY